MSNSDDPSHITTQRNSTQQNSLNPFHNSTFFTLPSDISSQDIPSETPHLSPLTFRHRQSLLQPNFSPRVVPIFVSSPNSDLNFLCPYSLQRLPSQNLNNLSFLQNIERNNSQSTPRFIQYNSLSPHFIRRVDNNTTLFIPTSRFRALPFATISPVNLPSLASFESSTMLEPLALANPSSTIRLPTSTTSNEVSDRDDIRVKISIPVHTEPTDEKKRDIIKSSKRKPEKEMFKDPRKKIRRPSNTTNDTMDNDNVSIIKEVDMTFNSEKERELNKEPGERPPLRRSARIAKDKQKRVLFYETLSQLSKKRKRMDESDNNYKAKPDEPPQKRRGRPRKNEQKSNGRPRGREKLKK
ncbi:12892_t:CDS:2 [Funneliformis geosporum]|uniref:18703_t:CDS:1 n=1 Tax=Funneliformis geosporum TaxID=1117311 RepID=A0A9W4WYU4_9GLOM|nr:12892_t:CDS:2 [Funneliformis geosporum]CAI2173755.1 18703_t:CDS:2 [Funneliformis geosporum]